MERLSEIISRLYEKYLPKIKAVGITFDLDFPDTTIIVKDKERVEKDLDKSLSSAITRAKNGKIKITVRKNKITVSDSGLVLDRSTCEKLSNDYVKVKSRVGFGTTVTIQG